MSTSKEIEVIVEHPMEEILDIEPGTTLVPRVERTTELVSSEHYDEKDQEIEEQVQEIYDAAMGAFETQMEEAELVEGKYKARNGEVAVQFLNAALNAAKEKANLKQHKDKMVIAQNKYQGPNTVNQNLIVADRNEILKRIANNSED